MSFLTSGSPPVRRMSVTPFDLRNSKSFSASAVLMSGYALFGPKQCTQLLLHLDVTLKVTTFGKLFCAGSLLYMKVLPVSYTYLNRGSGNAGLQ